MTYHLVVYITRYIVSFFKVPVKQHTIKTRQSVSDPDQPHLAKPSGNTPIGGSALRLDSTGKVTGKTRYAEDIVLPEMLHAAVFRSPHHHARLRSLDTQLAAQAPGVVRIITAHDIPGDNNLTGYSHNEPILTPVGVTLRQKGAPVALVVADSIEHARQAAALIEADFEPLPYIFEAEQALQPDATQIYPAGNVLNTFTLAHGDLQAAWNASITVIETNYYTAFQEHSTLERETTLGYIDEQGG